MVLSRGGGGEGVGPSGGGELAPLVGSAALGARVAELVDAGELDSPDPRSCRFESCLGHASLLEGDDSVSDPS